MAAGGEGVPQLGGYDYEFVSEVPDKWMCLICQLPLKNPMQIEECGHRLCQICINEVMRRPRAACPADRTPITRDQVFRDAGCKREIEDLHVKCPIKDCSWTGELRAVEAHGTNCLHVLVSCDNDGCQKKLKRMDLPAHMKNTCDWRIVECKHCHDNLSYLNLMIHWKQCKRFPLPCENGCGVKGIAREKLVTHLTECPLTVIPCEYNYLGCEIQAPRSQMDGHMAAALQRHLDLACRKLKQEEIKSELQEEKIAEQQEKLQRQERKINKQGQQIQLIHSEFAKKMDKAEKNMAKVMDKLYPERINETFTWDYKENILQFPSVYVRKSDMFYLKGYKMNCFMTTRKPSTSPPGLYQVSTPKIPIYFGLHINAGDFDSDVDWPFSKTVQIKLSSWKYIDIVYDKHIVKPKKPIPRPEPGHQMEIGSAYSGTFTWPLGFPVASLAMVIVTITFVEQTE